MIDALVLAGSPNDGPLKECSPESYEALIPIGKKTMVEYVVDALKASERINRIVVVGPPDELKKKLTGEVAVVSSGGNIMQNVLAGLKQLPAAGYVLLATCDIPLITPQAIEDFLDLCKNRRADLYYPIIPRSVVEKKYDQAKRTYVTLKEGEYTGGNLFLLNPVVVEICMSKGQELVDARKSPIKLCRLLGTGFLLKFLLRSLSLGEAESRVSTLLGVNGAVVISNYPEVGVDVDKPVDLELAARQLDLA